MPPENILVRGVNWLGDAIMTLPALQRLREAKPGARLTLVTPEKLAGLWEGQGLVDQVATFAPGESVWTLGGRLRAGQFSAAVAFPNSVRSALELWLARVPRRFGLARSWRKIFLTNPLPPRPGSAPMRKRSKAEIEKAVQSGYPLPHPPATAHHALDYLYLTSHLGASADPLPPRLTVPDWKVDLALRKFAIDSSDARRPWFGLNPGAEYGPAKRWPAERFVEAALELQNTLRCRWIIFGGAGDIELAGRIAADIQRQGAPMSVVNLAGKTSLSELAALLQFSRLVLTNDTGPMHLAAAVGAPMLALFGSTSPELTGPIFSPAARILRAEVPCSPCFLRQCPIDFRCMKALTVPDVTAAARSVAGM